MRESRPEPFNTASFRRMQHVSICMSLHMDYLELSAFSLHITASTPIRPPYHLFTIVHL